MPRSTATRSHGKRKKQRQQAPAVASRPPVQPVTARKRWPWLIALIAALVLVSFGIWHALSGSPTSASKVLTIATTIPSPTPTPKRNWQTVLTINGNNDTKNTKKIEVPADWQFTWSCRGVDGADGGLYISVYNANGSLYDAGAQITCLAAKQDIGSLEEHKSGNIYLNINSNDPWTVSVQKPQ